MEKANKIIAKEILYRNKRLELPDKTGSSNLLGEK